MSLLDKDRKMKYTRWYDVDIVIYILDNLIITIPCKKISQKQQKVHENWNF